MIKVKRLLICVLLILSMTAAMVTPSFAAYIENINEIQIYYFILSNLGLNEACACGIMANMWGESRFRPTAENPYGGAYGLCQWLGSRKTALINFCNNNGYKYNTVEGQLRYLKYELEHSEWNAYNKMKAVKNNTADGAFEAGYVWQQYFERGPSQYRDIYAKKARDTFWPEYRPQPIHSGKCPSYGMYDVPAVIWYHDSVDYVMNRGFMTGVSSIRFEPNSNLTRAMLVSVLQRMNGGGAAGANNFKDVKSGQWYTNAVLWASANGIVSGYPDGTFRPNENITREQVATIFYNFAVLKKFDTSKRADLNKYGDGWTVSQYARPAVPWAISAGIFSGNDKGALYPLNNATRAEIASMVQRFATAYGI